MGIWFRFLILFFAVSAYGQESFHIQVDYELNQDDVAVITKGIEEFNTPFFGHEAPLSFALYLKDEKGKVFGGILAWTRPGIKLLCIDTVWVAKELRHQGFGKQLMEAVENEGRKNGCAYAQLETLSFQAEGFYKKLGYFRIGLVEKLYGEHDAIYLRKNLGIRGDS